MHLADAICDSPHALIQSRDQGTTLHGVPMIHTRHCFGTTVFELEGANNSIADFGHDLLGVVGRMLAQTMESGIDRSQLRANNRRLQNALEERLHPKNCISSFKPMLALYEMIDKVARMKTTVLILGEGGMGKELVAHARHFTARSRTGPLRNSIVRRCPKASWCASSLGMKRARLRAQMRCEWGASKSRLETRLSTAK